MKRSKGKSTLNTYVIARVDKNLRNKCVEILKDKYDLNISDAMRMFFYFIAIGGELPVSFEDFLIKVKNGRY